MFEKRFYPNKEYMPADDIDECILDVSKRRNLGMVENDIDDTMRQKYVDISYAVMFDAISNGEEFYCRVVENKFVDYVMGD